MYPARVGLNMGVVVRVGHGIQPPLLNKIHNNEFLLVKGFLR